MKSRILVADDEADIRVLIRFILQSRGYEVIDATTGDEAIAAMRREHPDLALLDVMMPGLSGIEVAEEAALDSNTADIPFVFLSASAASDDIQKGLRVGAKAYLAKPFSPNKLAEVIAQVLTPQ